MAPAPSALVLHPRPARSQKSRRQKKIRTFKSPTPESAEAQDRPIPSAASRMDRKVQRRDRACQNAGIASSLNTATSHSARNAVFRRPKHNSRHRRLSAAHQPKPSRYAPKDPARTETQQDEEGTLQQEARTSLAEELEAQPSFAFQRMRKNLRYRGDNGKGPNMTSRYMAAKGRHIKFDDDGIATAVKHDKEAFLAGISGAVIENEEEGKAVETDPDVKGEPELDRSMDPAIRSELQGETKVVYGASLLETVPEEIFFGILDVLSKPLIAHKYATVAKNETAFKQLYNYNCMPSVLDNIASQHPFLKLAQTSKLMRDKIENYCQHATHRLLNNIIPSAEAKIKGKQMAEEHLVKKVKQMQKTELRAKKLVVEDKTWRINWLNLSWRRCQFCGKGTSRRAVFHFMTWCCHKCDTVLWPKKKRDDISSTQGTLIHAIHLDDLPAVFPSAKKLQVAYDWSVKDRFYLKGEIKALQELLMAEDPELKKTEEAELAERRRQVRFGNVPMERRCPWSGTRWSYRGKTTSDE